MITPLRYLKSKIALSSACKRKLGPVKRNRLQPSDPSLPDPYFSPHSSCRLGLLALVTETAEMNKTASSWIPGYLCNAFPEDSSFPSCRTHPFPLTFLQEKGRNQGLRGTLYIRPFTKQKSLEKLISTIIFLNVGTMVLFGFEVQNWLIPRVLSSLLRLEQGLSILILNPPHLKKNWNTIKGHMSENLIWRICDENFILHKKKMFCVSSYKCFGSCQTSSYPKCLRISWYKIVEIGQHKH